MSRFAYVKISTGKVVNVIIADAAFVLENTPAGCSAQSLNDNSPVGPDWTFNAGAGTYTEPVPDPEVSRRSDIELTIQTDTVLQLLKTQTNAEYDAWWTTNITNAAQPLNAALTVLKRLLRVVVRRLL